MYENVLREGKIGSLTLKNRFVMSAMGADFWPGVHETTVAWFEERAKGGFGLIITGFQAVVPSGKGEFFENVVSEVPSEQYAHLADVVHQHGAKLFVQIHHAGRQQGHADGIEIAESASAIPCTHKRCLTRELRTDEVWAIIEAFGDSALKLKEAGVDGVEIHGGHGYLADTFMSGNTNQRTDEFGGDLAGRAKFPVEVVKNIRKKCGDDFPICFKISREGGEIGSRKLNETIMICKMLVKAGVDAIDVSNGNYTMWHKMMPPYQEPVGLNADGARAIKQAVNVPVMCVGRMNDPMEIDSFIEDGYMDFAVLGRPSIADAHFPNKVAEGLTDEICPCVGCLTSCQGMIGSTGQPGATMCAMNPFSHNETMVKLYPAQEPKHIVVVGGGFAGMNAAWVAAARGHKVTLLEKGNKLGGQVLLAMVPPSKNELSRAVKYFTNMCKKYGVDIRTETEANADNIMALKPDHVVLATGATPIIPGFAADGNVVLAQDILSGKVLAGNNCLVLGGGLVGIETAEFIVSQNREADVVEMRPTVGEEQSPYVWINIARYLKDENVNIMTGTKVKKLTADGAVCETADGEVVLSGYDMLVLALGTKPYNPLEAELKDLVEVSVVGDAFGGPYQGTQRAAVDGGVFKALSL